MNIVGLKGWGCNHGLRCLREKRNSESRHLSLVGRQRLPRVCFLTGAGADLFPCPLQADQGEISKIAMRWRAEPGEGLLPRLHSPASPPPTGPWLSLASSGFPFLLMGVPSTPQVVLG